MEIKQIKDLMTSMGRLGIKKLSIKNKEVELQLEKDGFDVSDSSYTERGYANEGQSYPPIRKAGGDLPRSNEHAPLVAANTPKSESPGSFITSPMVGTFYAAPSPDAPPFVKPGQKVEKDTVVCIIEAMKVMNEIKAGQAGTIADKLVETESPVEFGTKLFKIN